VTVGGHLVVRGPDDPGTLALATAVVDAALQGPRWSAVSVLVESASARLLSGVSWAERVCVIEAGEAEAWHALEADAALLLSASPAAAWGAFRARVPRRAGVAGGLRGALLTHGLLPPVHARRRLPLPPIHLQRDLAGLLDIQVGARPPRLRASADGTLGAVECLGRAGLSAGTPYALGWPEAERAGVHSRPAATIAAALERLEAESGLAGVVLADASASAGPDLDAVKLDPAAVARVPVGSDLELTVALIAGASLVLAEGEGARWIAAALDVPCVRLPLPDARPSPAGFPERARIVRPDDPPRASASAARRGGRAPGGTLAAVVDAALELLAAEERAS